MSDRGIYRSKRRVRHCYASSILYGVSCVGSNVGGGARADYEFDYRIVLRYLSRHARLGFGSGGCATSGVDHDAAEARENLLVALDTLRSHKVRSSLTILGIVIGVTSVISVASIIDGLNAYIQNKVESFGARTYFVSRIPLGPRFGRMPEKIRMRKYIPAYGCGIHSRRVSFGRIRDDLRYSRILLWAKQRYPICRKRG